MGNTMFFSSNVFGIDLGTGNIKIYSKNDDNIVIEKNVIAIENRQNVFAYGDDAYDMYEKAPANIKVSYPLNHGVIADIKNMEMLVKYFITDISRRKVVTSDFLLAIPSDITEVEKRAFFDLIKCAGVKAKKIYAVEKGLASGYGLIDDFKNCNGILAVDIGFETTEISILSKGGIVVSRLLKIGGATFDEAIKAAVKKEYNLLIGSKTAEHVKMSISELTKNNTEAVVYGRDMVTGLPREKAIPTKLVTNCLEEYMITISENVKSVLERTPPEFSADLYQKGIYLTGGSSTLNGLKEKIEEVTKLKVTMSENPITNIAFGLAKLINDDIYKNIAYTIEGMGK